VRAHSDNTLRTVVAIVGIVGLSDGVTDVHREAEVMVGSPEIVALGTRFQPCRFSRSQSALHEKELLFVTVALVLLEKAFEGSGSAIALVGHFDPDLVRHQCPPKIALFAGVDRNDF
jgi:hypothetical protein